MQPVVVPDDSDVQSQESGVGNSATYVFCMVDEAESPREGDFPEYVETEATYRQQREENGLRGNSLQVEPVVKFYRLSFLRVLIEMSLHPPNELVDVWLRLDHVAKCIARSNITLLMDMSLWI